MSSSIYNLHIKISSQSVPVSSFCFYLQFIELLIDSIALHLSRRVASLSGTESLFVLVQEESDADFPTEEFWMN